MNENKSLFDLSSVRCPQSWIPSPIKRLNFPFKENNYKVLAKCEFLNPTGSHKDRESLGIFRLNNFEANDGVSCASTGNLARSLSYFSALYNIPCHIWMNPKKCSNLTVEWLNSTGATLHLLDEPLHSLYSKSDKYAFENNLFSANPGNSDIKIKANSEILTEIAGEFPEIRNVFTCTNNGSHVLGLLETAGKYDSRFTIHASYTSAKICESISGFTNRENPSLIKKAVSLGTLETHFVSREEILLVGKICTTIGLHIEPSSWAALVPMFKNSNIISNSVVILTGSSINKLDNFIELTKSPEW